MKYLYLHEFQSSLNEAGLRCTGQTGYERIMNDGKKRIQYGKLINGKLYAFPGFVTEEGQMVYHPSEEIIRQHGFKEVLSYETVSEQGPFDKLIWQETDRSIKPVLLKRAIPADLGSTFARQYRDKKFEFEQVQTALSIIQDGKSKITLRIKDIVPAFGNLYDLLVAENPDKTLDELAALLKVNQLGDLSQASLSGHRIRVVPTETKIEIERHDDEINVPFFLVAPFFHLQKQVTDFECFQYRMLFCYLHTLFDDFLSKCIRLIITIYPAGAGLKPELSVKQLFGCEDIDELREQIIEQAAVKLGYGSYQDKIGFLRKHGFTPTLPQEELLDDMILFCEQRNILIHNDGIVNRVFLNRIADTKYAGDFILGQNLRIREEDVRLVLSKVMALCDNLYSVIHKKCHL